MKLKTVLMSTALMAACAVPMQSANAQDRGGGLPFTAKMSRTFGPTGLISEFGQNESMGSVAVRQAQSRAQIAAAYSDGIFTGYADEAHRLSVPATIIFNAPSLHGAFKVKGTALGSISEKNLTYSNSNGAIGLLQYLTMPTDSTLLAIGITGSGTNVDIRQNNGALDTKNFGFQVDVLQNLDDHWGLFGRALYRWNQTKTTIPLPFTNLVTEQGSQNFYGEVTLVGNFEKDTLSWLPEGWMLRPRVRALYTGTSFEEVRNSLGGINDGTIGPWDDYATIQGKLQFLQPVFRPGQSGFYGEAGYEREVINDLDLVVDDPNILLGKVGYRKMFDNGFFMDVGFAREQGFKGDRNQDNLTFILSKTF